MPTKRRFRKTFKRRSGRGKSGFTSREYKALRASNYSRVPRYLTPFPTMYKIKLVYTGWVNNGTVADGINTYTGYTFKLNSCHDPYAGVSGSYNVQPYFWDQISAIYKRYTVSSAKVELQFNRPGSDAFHVMRPTTVSTTPSDFQLEESRPYAVKRTNTIYGTGCRMRAYYPVHKIHGVTPQKVKTDDLFSAAVGSDPALVMYLQVLNQMADGVTTTSTACPFNIKITQYVTMFDRTVVSGS